MRFDINASSLPEEIRERLLPGSATSALPRTGVVVIKAQQFRSLEESPTRWRACRS